LRGIGMGFDLSVFREIKEIAKCIIISIGYNFIEWLKCVDIFLDHNRAIKDLVRKWKNGDYNNVFALLNDFMKINWRSSR
jgi:hypothetical protein